MSKFLSYYNLFPIPDPKEFLGIAGDGEEGNVITTLARNVVVILNISTQKQLRSWSMPEKLSAKVIYDRSVQKYVGVFGNHSLRLWDANTPDVSKCKKLKFQKSIALLVATDLEALVLYSDGTCEPLSKALESRKDQQEDTAEQLSLAASRILSKATVHSLPDGLRLLTYFKEMRATGDLELVRHSLSTGENRFYPIKREMVRVTGYAVIDCDTAPHLLTIWSDKRIFMLSLAEHAPERIGSQFVSMLSELNVESKLSVHGVSRNFAAIYGANYGQEGASLLVYNTQFKVVNAKQYFKVYLDFSRLWSCGEHILLAMGNNIAAVRYRTNRELLVDMLGSQFSDTNMTPIELDHINEEEALESTIKMPGKDEQITPLTYKKHINTSNVKSLPPADGKLVAHDSPETFDKELKELIKSHVHGEIVYCDNATEDINITLMTNFFDDGPQNTAVQSMVRQLERSGAGEQEITEKLLTLFIKTQNTEQLLMCLRRYSNISERMLAWSLCYALDNYTIKPTADASTNGDIMEVDDACRGEEVLNAVLACSFDANTIVDHLRERLHIPHVLSFLVHLYKLISKPDLCLEERPNYDASLAHTELQTLKWVGAVLTSHFTLLVISTDPAALNILTKWSKILRHYKESIFQTRDVLPVLSNIVQKRKPKTKVDNRWYCIERMPLF